MTKLTLSVREAVVRKAKEIAEANNTSISAMFSHFVESLSSSDASTDGIGPVTRKLSGVVDLPPDREYAELRDEALAERYGTVK